MAGLQRLAVPSGCLSMTRAEAFNAVDWMGSGCLNYGKLIGLGLYGVARQNSFEYVHPPCTPITTI